MSQNQRVFEALKKAPLTSMQAFRNLGITRLSARIYDLRHEGHRIESERVRVHTRNGTATVARYYLEAE